MDIELLSKMVGELLLDHDAVGLPGLGTFIAEVVPASFSDRGYTINPPYRRLSFHSGYPSDDTLAAYYSGTNGRELAEAKAILADYVAQVKAVLNERRIVVFPGLGRMRTTREGTVFFVADEQLDIYPDGFALESVSLKTHTESPEDLSLAVSSLREIIVPAAEPEPIPEPAPEPTPEPAQEPAQEPESVPAPVPEPVPVAETPSEDEPAPVKKSRWWLIPVIVICVAVLTLAAFLILAHVAPDFIDKILYTPEELRIINYEL